MSCCPSPALSFSSPCTSPPSISQQFLDAAPEDPGDPWPPGFEEEGRAALAEFTKAYEPELADEATSRAINEAMAAGEWVEEEEEEELAEEAGPIIPDVTAMTAEQLSRWGAI